MGWEIFFLGLGIGALAPMAALLLFAWRGGRASGSTRERCPVCGSDRFLGNACAECSYTRAWETDPAVMETLRLLREVDRCVGEARTGDTGAAETLAMAYPELLARVLGPLPAAPPLVLREPAHQGLRQRAGIDAAELPVRWVRALALARDALSDELLGQSGGSPPIATPPE